MTIASEIARLQGVKADILGAIAEKKVDVPSGAMLADAPDLIRSIKSGINVKIGQGVYPAVKIGNQLWLARNLDEELGTLGVDEWYYNGRVEAMNLLTNKGERSFNLSSVVGYSNIYRELQELSGNELTTGINPKFNIDIFIKGHIRFSKSLSKSVSFTCRLRDPASDIVLTGSSFTIPAGVSEYDLSLSTKTPNIADRLWESLKIRQDTEGENISGVLTGLVVSYNSNTTESSIIPSQALANEATAKANNYGRLYTWNNVNDNLSKLNLGGWRLPSNNDLNALRSLDTSGKKLRSKDFYNGTDDYGLNLLGSGYFNESAFLGIGTNTFINSSTFQNKGCCLNVYRTGCDVTNFYPSSYGRSCRLVLDLNEDGTIPNSNIVLEDVPATTAEPLALASEPIVTEEVE